MIFVKKLICSILTIPSRSRQYLHRFIGGNITGDLVIDNDKVILFIQITLNRLRLHGREMGSESGIHKIRIITQDQAKRAVAAIGTLSDWFRARAARRRNVKLVVRTMKITGPIPVEPASLSAGLQAEPGDLSALKRHFEISLYFL